MKGTIAGLLMLTLLLAACAEPTPRAPVYETNVHLQAEYQVPLEVEGVRSLFTNMRYLIYLPDGYGDDPHKEWPLIFFLHGSGSGVNDSAFVLSYGLPEVLVNGDQPDNFEFIIVSPQAFPGITWWLEFRQLLKKKTNDERASISRLTA